MRTHGFGGRYVYDIWFNPNEAHAAQAGGPLGYPQWISVGPDAFSGGYAFCVSVIGHEIEHAKQRAGEVQGPPDVDNPEQTGPKPIESDAVREFLAYSWEVLDSPVRLEDDLLYAMCFKADEAYRYLDGFTRAYYQERYNRVVAIWRTLPAPKLE